MRPSVPTAADRRAEEQARMVDLYGDALSSVAILQKRGFVVSRESGKIRVGNKLLTSAEVKNMAEREGGLAGMAFTLKDATVSGRKVGHTEALKPKKRTPSAAVPRAPRPLAGAAAATKAKAAEHSAELGTRPRVVWLDLALLKVDKRYQRDITEGHGQAHVNRILKAFNWNCYQPIIVAERDDGTYAVIDGQHRLAAAKKHPAIDSLPCYIIDAPDVAAQAAIFVAVNSVRKSLTGLQKFWASHAAGEAIAVGLAKACSVANVTILRGPPSYDLPPRSIVGAVRLQEVARKLGLSPVAEALKVLAEAHPEKVNAFRSPTLAALARIAADAGYSRDRLLAILKKLDTDKLHDEARANRIAEGGTLETATARVLQKAMK